MLIPDCLIMALACVLAFYVMRYNVHMFQLNGYKNVEHFNWIKKNHRKQGLLYVLAVIGIISIIFKSVIVYVFEVIFMLIALKYFMYLKSSNTKKKLVYTNRVKRLMATETVICVVIIVLGMVLWERRAAWFAAALVCGVQMVLTIAANYINKPIEKAVNNHFINDAKRILKGNPDMVIVGVTGSYGKTSMKYYLKTLLQDHFDVLITPESFNTPMGVVRTVREHMTPMNEVFICEMGARHVGDIKELCDLVHPKHGVITSVGPQHLETFFNIENVVNTKFELADALPEDGMLILNGDNELIREKGKQYKNAEYYYTAEPASTTEKASTTSTAKGYYAKDVSLSQMGTEFTVVTPIGESERFSMRLIGEYNVVNVVGAITVANKLGVPLKDLRTAVRKIQPVAHRMQMLEHGNYTIIDDAYNSNPVGSKAAVETLAMFDGIKIMITPGMVELGDKEDEFNYKFGTYAAKCCDYVLLVGRKHTEPIRKGLLDSGYDEEKTASFDKIEDALSYAYNIKGTGHKYILLENDLPDNY